MIDLSSEPSLGTLILSQDGVLKYSYVLPRGMTFPTGSEATIVFSDRAGGVYELGNYKYGDMSDDLTTFTWVIGSVLTNQVSAGDNFEVFVNVDGDVYKVRYGRVVRKEVSYPLNPITVAASPLMYEDDMQRNVPGPRWLTMNGGVSMLPVTFAGGNSSLGTKYTMAPRYKLDLVFGLALNLFSKASVLWYAPMTSDNIEISVKVVAGETTGNSDGDCVIVFASNSSMNSWLGLRIRDPGGTGTDTLQFVQGSTEVPSDVDTNTGVTVIGSSATYDSITSNAATSSTYTYRITYNGTSSGTNPNSVSLYTPASTSTAALTTSIASTSFKKGAGYRYTGLMFTGSFITTGPRVFYWKAKDAL